MSYIEFQNITKEYNTGGNAIFAKKDASLSVEKGELAIILGASGAGKTTALNILGGMDTATSGHVMVDGSDITTYGKKQLTQYRRTDIGFVFQFYNLVPNLTALENVELASQICNDSLNAEQTLVKVGLEQRIKNFPAQLSGGEQQRVSIARALAKNPKLLLCDEPTGALDSKSGRQVMELFQKLNDEGVSVLMITHDPDIAAHAKRVVMIRDGELQEKR